MATNRAPKQWTLSKTETITTFESWRQNLLYILALDPQFAPFLGEGTTWEKKTRTRPNRGFADDNEDIAVASRRTANQKATMLDLMLGQVANYCPIVSRNTIVKNSKSMDDIWQTLRSHFGFQCSGGHFLDFCEIKLQAGERHEDLYQRLMAFVEDNLLTVTGGIRHMGEPPQDEEMPPTLENLIVLTWLRLLHDDLPRLVKQRYGTELRSRTLASIKPEISQAMDTLLDECRSNSSINVIRSVGPTSYRQKVSRGPPKRCCPLCSQAGKDSNHFLSRCQFLPDADRKFMTKIRHIGMESEECEEDITQIIDNEHRHPSTILLVQPKKSPYLFMYYDSKTLKVTLDTGAETNMIRHSTAKQLGLPTYRSSQNVHQADGKSPLKVTGETKVKFVRGSLTFTFHALVVEDLDVDILGGVPFTDANDISIRTSKQLIILEDGSKVYYKVSESETRPSVRRTQPFILRSPSHVTVWPGDFIKIKLPEEVEENEQLALEPRSDENTCEWPSPHIVTTVGGMVRLSNQSRGPVQPPQRKGRIPQYNRSKLQELQDKCDELERQGVLRRPEESALSDSKVITLPRPEDQLFIVTDGAVKNRGIGATMYVMRSNKPVLAGFFSAKLRAQQIRWLPCEVEALGIATAIKHFSPFITQSHHTTSILTDSKPCVQAFGKLCRGEFSSSPRVSTFLSTASRFQVTIRHLTGSANVPSDFASRNAPACDSPVCQICQFIITTEDSVVHSISTTDILSGDKRLPFTSRSAWRLTQQECPDLRRSHAHLKQGIRPSKKITDARDIKRYLQVVTIAKDGLIVVRREHNMAQCKECIVVPRQVIDGLLVALHLKLNHPTAHQLKVTFTRFFYCLDMDQSITRTTDSCHQCVALKPSPQFLQPQTTSDPPEAMGVVFAADIIRRERQFVLVVRECITSYTRAIIIDNEKHDTLREALITLCTDLHPSGGPLSVIRTDAGPGFVALNDDVLLKHHHLCIEIGNIKNPNKNPVHERAVQELEREILKHDPTGGPVTAFQLTLIVSQLNSRIRNRGLSAREMLYKRDQFCNSSLPISDQQLAIEQHDHRMYNHPHSETSKAPNHHLPPENDICVGDLVYLYSDGSKTKGRSRYLVVTIEGMWCNVRKFIGNQLRATSYRVKKHDCYKVTPDYHTEVVRPSIDDELYTSDYTEEIIQSDTDSPIGNRPEYSMEATNALEHQPDINIDMLPQPTPPDPPDIPEEISSSDPPLSQNRYPLPTTPVSRPQRNRKAPSYLKDYVVQ